MCEDNDEINWDWIGPLVILGVFNPNPIVRKLSIYRLITNGVGISDGIAREIKKKGGKKRGGGDVVVLRDINVIPLEFFPDVLLPSLSSLGAPPNSTHFEYTDASNNNSKVDVDLREGLVAFLGRRLSGIEGRYDVGVLIRGCGSIGGGGGVSVGGGLGTTSSTG